MLVLLLSGVAALLLYTVTLGAARRVRAVVSWLTLLVGVFLVGVALGAGLLSRLAG